jgi:CheY-like chemotaxis protein
VEAWSGLRVLLAEDDALLGLAAEDVLREAGHAVALARDGAEALALARGGASFDVLVTDLDMPRLDGAALTRRLREGRPSLPVVAVTGYALSAEDRATLAGGEGRLVLLRKPWTPEEMVEAVRRAAGDGAGGGGVRA